MFTGIVDHCGEIVSVKRTASTLRLGIKCGFTDMALGESISVDGICLTVTDREPNQFSCDLSPETMAVTVASRYTVGTILNLERALRLSDRLGGHYVSGHVDTSCVVCEKSLHSEFVRLVFGDVSPEFERYLVKKGSISINGVSLTINETSSTRFEVMLIPHTLDRTNLKSLTPGDYVNIEFDWMLKVVLHEAERLKLVSNRL